MGSLTVRLKAEGDALAARGDYEAAAVKYQAAANQQPEDVSIRFALGSALSHLGRREETIQQFSFVVARGKPDSAEARAARRWLVAAGEVAESVAFAPSRTPAEEASRAMGASAGSPPAAVPGVKVKVRTESRPGTRDINIVLADSSRALAFEKTGKLGEAFEFPSVPPGEYQLIAQDVADGSEIWNVPLTVAAGKEIMLDLK